MQPAFYNQCTYISSSLQLDLTYLMLVSVAQCRAWLQPKHQLSQRRETVTLQASCYGHASRKDFPPAEEVGRNDECRQ